ncbi:WD40 repeat-like protein [Atractiella rhizophila]|nr:WD40 repeat-like protein [Atractiella rhizophila]
MEEDDYNDGVDVDDLLQQPTTSYALPSHKDPNNVLVNELERRKRARKIAVPTNDQDVRNKLREIQEPMTLFGEGPAERRERLRYLLSKLEKTLAEEIESESESEEDEDNQEFFIPGSDELLEARRWIAQYSLHRAKERVERQRSEAALPLAKLFDVRRAIYSELKKYTNLGSQIGSSRPISIVRFSPSSDLLLTGSWSGHAKVWEVPSCNLRGGMQNGIVYKGHDGSERIGGAAWHPQATVSQSPTTVNFVTGAADGLACLWSLDNPKPLSILSGHAARIARVAFHPSGRYVGTASYDQTWRLWDVETSQEILLQEGHSKEVYAIEFQADGSLVCSGGLDAIGRVWDLRSGKTIMTLENHVKDVLAVDFSPNGYQIATGSNDDTIRIWDMRQLKPIYTIAAHRSSVSDVRFFKYDRSRTRFPSAFASLPVLSSNKSSANGGEEEMDVRADGDMNGAVDAEVDVPLDGLYLASSGYDGMLKIWSADDWQLVKALSSEAGGKVMSVDMSSDGKFMATGEWGRTFKLWSAEDSI